MEGDEKQVALAGGALQVRWEEKNLPPFASAKDEAPSFHHAAVKCRGGMLSPCGGVKKQIIENRVRRWPEERMQARFITIVTFCFILASMSEASATRSQLSPTLDSQIVEAKTVYLTAEILHPKDEKSPFSSELDTILALASGTRIWFAYKPATAEKADIIIKIVEDRTFGASWTLTLYVYDPEENRELYKEKREYVELRNDVHRLMNHLLNAVLERRKLNKEEAQQDAERVRAEEEAERERAGKDYEQGIGPARITCDAVKVYANRGAERRVKRVLDKGERVTIITPANSEAVIRIGDIVGYVDARCVEVLLVPVQKD